MAEREVFPYEADRALIADWLTNAGPRNAPDTDSLSVHGDKLRFNNRETIAWFDTAGALVVKLPVGMDYLSSARVIVEIAKQVGTTVVILRDRFDDFVHDPATGGSRHIMFNYFIDETPYEPGDPHVLVGPLGMQAYRSGQ